MPRSIKKWNANDWILKTNDCEAILNKWKWIDSNLHNSSPTTRKPCWIQWWKHYIRKYIFTVTYCQWMGLWKTKEMLLGCSVFSPRLIRRMINLIAKLLHYVYHSFYFVNGVESCYFSAFGLCHCFFIRISVDSHLLVCFVSYFIWAWQNYEYDAWGICMKVKCSSDIHKAMTKFLWLLSSYRRNKHFVYEYHSIVNQIHA